MAAKHDTETVPFNAHCSITRKEEAKAGKPTLFNAARLTTFTPSLSALRIASSIWSLMPFLANGKKYCNKRKAK